MRFLVPLLAALACSLVAPAPTAAQPDPSFRVRCGELRQSLSGLDLSDGRLVTLQVVGRLTAVRFDGALAYLFVCSAPDPQVLCISYSTNERRVGDEVVVSGGYEPGGPDTVRLDPCLHLAPDEPTAP